MTEWIDISVAIQPKMVVWPESIGFRHRWGQRIDAESEANVSHVELDVHTGTHIDSPLHFLEDGKTVDALPADRWIGPCWIVDCGDKKEIDLELVKTIPHGFKRVLFKSTNSSLWAQPDHTFIENYVALNLEAATYLADQAFELVGVDYLSVQKYHDSADTHRVLLQAEIVLLESINLSLCAQGEYELYCFPLKLIGTEAAPCRAFVKR